ncbi:MAG: hypothetical protein IPM55_05755 [Acidobacteria bacterium]|nr:hypothetical protein [Acidobacteriota bacterium]
MLVAPETRKVDDDKVVTDSQRAKKGTENNEEDPARSYDACSPDPPGFDRGICFSGKSRGKKPKEIDKEQESVCIQNYGKKEGEP